MSVSLAGGVEGDSAQCGDLVDRLEAACARDEALDAAKALVTHYFSGFSTNWHHGYYAAEKLLTPFSLNDFKHVSRTIRHSRERMGDANAVRFAFNKVMLVKGMPPLPASESALARLARD